MFKIGKYKFDNKEQAKEKINALPSAIDEDGIKYFTHNHTVVEIGKIVEIPSVYDETTQEFTQPTYKEGYHVDVLFEGLNEQPEGWENYSVEVSGEGSHSFFGVNYQTNKF